ncbi:hypothetical protein [Streptomyces sp. NRRL F-5123]|uniref:hypothetical protein n=1 Tax=Streptomyces sp. NRRL F-5123 TaxID=1463856 RepID=UPI0004E17E3F|nr:hypothetical protein [Streptomyces sp. NRRL F-5123]
MGADVSSGTADAALDKATDCLASPTLPTVVNHTVVYHWNAGRTSTGMYTLLATARLAGGTSAIAALGSVASGRGVGSPVTHLGAVPVLNPLACITTEAARTTPPDRPTVGRVSEVAL